MKKRVGYVLLILGVLTAITGYALHPWLWDFAYHHCLSVAFTFYTSCICFLFLRLKDKTGFCLGIFTWFCCLNAVFDEATNNADKLYVSEFVTILFVGLTIFLIWKKWQK